MKKNRIFTLTALLVFSAAHLLAANTTQRRSTTLNDSVAIVNNVDYILASATPFGDNGIVNIVNTEHAVVILEKKKPSEAIRLLADHVRIDGAVATYNGNCQVKLYNRGSIIMPYGRNIKPLTVYSEQNFAGEEASNFGLEDDGGFMNTMTDAQLNNRVRSFKLKRGYMVTFSTRAAGRGYSRCFIAAKADLEIATLPAVLDQKITSYRVFKWYDTGKQQLAAAGGDHTACSMLNVTSTYTWGGTSDMAPDVENVPHHIKDIWGPSISGLGQCTTSPHMKTNNEPMNLDDDPKGQTEDIDLVLSNWEELMATGMRLCSPSSWDGSDYTNGTGYIKRFIDSIDARGWRCDIIDLHCYWPESNFGTIRNWTNSTGRPVWISEWVWGASWNSNGAFANGVTEAQNAAALKRICPVLNNNDCIERYYYWNGERDPSRLIKDGKLTEAGQYYATIDGGVGYNGKYDFIPTTPKQKAPSAIAVQPDGESGLARISWTDPNGEFNQQMVLERSTDGGTTWAELQQVEQPEAPGTVSVVDSTCSDGYVYRVYLIDLNGTKRYTKTAVYQAPIYRRAMNSGEHWGTICRPKAVRPVGDVVLYDVVGVTPDETYLCLEPLSEAAPGHPCVFSCTGEEATFFEYGQAAGMEDYDAMLTGTFLGITLSDGNVMLQGNEWYAYYTATTPEMPKLPAYEAILWDCDPEFVPRMASWSGKKMRVHGLPGEDLTGISNISSAEKQAETYYRLDGTRTQPHRRGLLIRKQGGSAHKVVVK